MSVRGTRAPRCLPSSQIQKPSEVTRISDRLQAQQIYVPTETCSRLGRKPHPLFKLLSVREEEIRQRRWRNNAGRSCAAPIDEAKAALQQQELDWPVVAQLIASFSFRKQEQCRGAPFFAPFSGSRVFSKKNKTDRSLRFPGVIKKFFTALHGAGVWLIHHHHGTRSVIFFGGYGYVTTQDGTSRSESLGLRRLEIERSAHGHCSAPSHPCRALG